MNAHNPPHPVIDAHMHLWDRVHGTVQGKTPVVPVANGVVRIGDNDVLGMPAYMLDCRARAEYFIAEMEAAGVGGAVVVQEYLDGEQNDYLLETASRYPGRFFMHALPDWFNADGVAAEVGALLSRGFRGIKLPAMHLTGTTTLDDIRFMAAYEQVHDAGAVLAIDLCEDEAQVPAMRRVLDRFPALKVAVGHFGMPSRGGWPGQLELCRYENVYIETGGIVWLYRAHGTGFAPALDAVCEAIEHIGADKIMWGSDWPRTMTDFTYDQSLAFLRDTDRISETDKARVLAGNARRLYGFPADTPAPAKPIPRITEG